MFPKQFCLLVICILTFQTQFSLPCSRSHSKTARNLLSEKGSFEFIEGYDLPEKCPLRPEVGLLIGSGLSGGVGGLCAISELTLCGYLNRNEFTDR